MAKQYSSIDNRHREFIEKQKMFFVATAARDGRVNVSPKGGDTLRVISANRVVWVNLTGSGNETAAHVLENQRMTLMLCAFSGDPKILRLYGNVQVVHPRDPDWSELCSFLQINQAARQIFDLSVDLVVTSCGFGIPLYDYAGERDLLDVWAKKKGEEGIKDYWKTRNRVSLDGKPTGI